MRSRTVFPDSGLAGTAGGAASPSSRALSAAEILRSATVVNAELLQRPGELGVVAPGARADLLLVDGKPLENIALLDGQGEHLDVVLKGGRIVVDRISQS